MCVSAADTRCRTVASDHHVLQVVRFRNCFGHARKGGKFVNDAAKVTNLADDGVSALLEHIPCLK